MKIKRWDVRVLESKRVLERHNSDFFTSDTDAWAEIHLVDQGISPTSATVVAYNQSDESLVEEEHPVVNNLIKFPFYTDERNLIEHSGCWLLTVIFDYEGKKYTSREIAIHVNGSISDGVPERLEIVENWNKVRAEIDAMRDAEIVRETNELDRARLYNEVQEKLATGEFDGKDGKDGEDGYTPVKGVDYFDGKDGIDGVDGKDGESFKYSDFTPEQLAELEGPQGKDGPAGKDGIDGVDGEQGPVGPAPDWVVISAAEYDALIEKDPQTVYLVTDTNKSRMDVYMDAIDIMLDSGEGEEV